MFDEAEFEKRIYGMVTDEVNGVFMKLVKEDEEALQGNGVRMQLSVMKALHGVIEEMIIQMSYGLNVYQRYQDVKRAQKKPAAVTTQKKPVVTTD